jgi:hypothetical protein
VRRFRETGSVAPGQMGGHKPKAISGEHRAWLVERAKARDFTLRGLVAELAERGLKVDYRAVWNFVHAEKLSFKKNQSRQRIEESAEIGPLSGTSSVGVLSSLIVTIAVQLLLAEPQPGSENGDLIFNGRVVDAGKLVLRHCAQAFRHRTVVTERIIPADDLNLAH